MIKLSIVILLEVSKEQVLYKYFCKLKHKHTVYTVIPGFIDYLIRYSEFLSNKKLNKTNKKHLLSTLCSKQSTK